MSSRVPRKQRNLKAAASASAAAGVETNSSNCSEDVTLQEVNNYEFYGLGKSLQSYTAGEVSDFASQEDQAKQVTGRTVNGAVASVKNAAGLLQRAISAGLSTSATNYFFNTTSTGVTGSSVLNFIYDKSGPQAGYIPHLVQNGAGFSATEEYVFFLPSSITGAAGSNMPAQHSRSFEVTIAGAVGAGESVQVYTASAAGTRVATGSAFTYSASFCSTPNYTHTTIHIPTSSLAGVGQAGIIIVYTASYTEDGTKENTPYSGLVVTINPSALI